jgi:excisionase family DNA binding protein
METGKQYVTVDEAAEYLGVHPQTVRRWLRDGQIQGTMISRAAGYRIRREEVEHVVEEGLREPTRGKELAAA